jgi:hypothetical protein
MGIYSVKFKGLGFPSCVKVLDFRIERIMCIKKPSESRGHDKLSFKVGLRLKLNIERMQGIAANAQ